MRTVVIASSALVVALACGDSAGVFGHFEGKVKTEWIEPDRKVQLLEDFRYVDTKGVRWPAPKGSIIDGASIPQVLSSGRPLTARTAARQSFTTSPASREIVPGRTSTACSTTPAARAGSEGRRRS